MATIRKLNDILLLVCFLMLTVCLSNCSMQKRLDRKCSKAQQRYELACYKYGCPWKMVDSVLVTQTVTTYRDTTIYIKLPGETVFDSIEVPVRISTPVSLLETANAISRAWIEAGLLKHELQQKQVMQPVTIRNALKEEKALQKEIIKVPVPVERKVKAPLTWAERTLIYSGIFAWLVIILYLIFKFKKKMNFRNWFG